MFCQESAYIQESIRKAAKGVTKGAENSKERVGASNIRIGTVVPKSALQI